MTLVFASFPSDSPPILGADCLLTGGETEPIDLPSGRNEEAGYVEACSKLCRKLYILTPHIAAIVSGRYVEVNRLLVDIKERIGTGQTAEESHKIFHEVWNNTEPKASTLIAYIYDPLKQSFRLFIKGHHLQDNVPALGNVFAAGSGAKKFLDNVRRYGGSENPSCALSASELSRVRAITFSYEIVASENINSPEDLGLNYNFGGFCECAYFDWPSRRFYLIDGLTVLFWSIEDSIGPEFKFFFGLTPRSEDESLENFHFFRTRYSQEGMRIEKYENIRKTRKGHLMSKKEYQVSNIVDSLNEVCSVSANRFVFNVYYVATSEPVGVPNRHFRTLYNQGVWVTRIPKGQNKYEIQITKNAANISREIVDWFMKFRSKKILSNQKSSSSQ